jgi:phosphatidylinositol dimannoside acyltransferase
LTLAARLGGLLRSDSDLWRGALEAGVVRGPDALLRYSPPAFGLFFAATLGAARRTVAAHLRQIRGPVSPWREAREVAAVFTNFASSMTEAMLAGADRGYQPVARPLDEWHFMRAVAAGRGVIVATAQTAGWDVAGSFLASVLPDPPPVWVLMSAEADAAARERHDRYREAAGVTIVHVGHDPLSSLPVLGHLRRGGIVALKFDRVSPGMRTRRVQFCGGDWDIPEGPLQLASLSGAPIVPVLTRRLGFLEYEVQNFPALRLPSRASDDARQVVADQLIGHLERFVQHHPTQWFHFGIG